jgi:hypothetical protein
MKGFEGNGSLSQLFRRRFGDSVPVPLPKPTEVDAVAKKAIERGGRHDSGYVPVSETKLERWRSETGCGRYGGRLPARVIESAE